MGLIDTDSLKWKVLYWIAIMFMVYFAWTAAAYALEMAFPKLPAETWTPLAFINFWKDFFPILGPIIHLIFYTATYNALMTLGVSLGAVSVFIADDFFAPRGTATGDYLIATAKGLNRPTWD